MAVVGAQVGTGSIVSLLRPSEDKVQRRGATNASYRSNLLGRSLAEQRRSSLSFALGGSSSIRCVASEPRPKKAELDKGILPIANPASEDAASVASNIQYHAEYTPTFSPLKFDVVKAYAATAESVRDNLIMKWNETYKHFHKTNPKHIHYLSMEFLQGRALQNAIGNLEIRDAYGQALRNFGYELEDVAEQVLVSSKEAAEWLMRLWPSGTSMYD